MSLGNGIYSFAGEVWATVLTKEHAIGQMLGFCNLLKAMLCSTFFLLLQQINSRRDFDTTCRENDAIEFLSMTG